MNISAFSFLRNAEQLYYPFIESILSVLDIVDEYVIMLGEGDGEDHTFDLLNNLNSSKLRIFKTQWDLAQYPGGSEYAHQTDLAKERCSGDWLLYLQGDEVIHEDDLSAIKAACAKYKQDTEVEGFVFNFLHFYGDYQHYFSDHTWYKKEIRIVRNHRDIHSWRDAQSFRMITDFVGNDYFRKKNTRKLKCIDLNARIFHYGWVRPPRVMGNKKRVAHQYYQGEIAEKYATNFDYGRMDKVTQYTGSHPICMQKRIEQLDWQALLRHDGPAVINRPKMKHERLKYRTLGWVEKHLLQNRTLGGFKNYNLVQR